MEKTLKQDRARRHRDLCRLNWLAKWQARHEAGLKSETFAETIARKAHELADRRYCRIVGGVV